MIWAYNSSSSSSFEFALKVDQTCETASFMLLYSKGMVYLYCSAFLNQKQTFSKKDGKFFQAFLDMLRGIDGGVWHVIV